MSHQGIIQECEVHTRNTAGEQVAQVIPEGCSLQRRSKGHMSHRQVSQVVRAGQLLHHSVNGEGVSPGSTLSRG
jgi:hypothetical protein